MLALQDAPEVMLVSPWQNHRKLKDINYFTLASEIVFYSVNVNLKAKKVQVNKQVKVKVKINW